MSEKINRIAVVSHGTIGHIFTAALAAQFKDHEVIVLDSPQEQKRFEIKAPPLASHEVYGFPKKGNHPPYKKTEPDISRNAACPCGSGRKYKRCCIK